MNFIIVYIILLVFDYGDIIWEIRIMWKHWAPQISQNKSAKVILGKWGIWQKHNTYVTMKDQISASLNTDLRFAT